MSEPTPSNLDPTELAAQVRRARDFAELHAGPGLFVLPNAWDAGSAAVLASISGVRAIATTSAGVAAAHGVPDGELLGLDHVVAAVTLLTRTVSLPVTVDLETGYGNTPTEVADSVASVIDAGAVGVNIEDGIRGQSDRLLAEEAHAARVAAARSAGEHLGVPIVVNARTDVFWRRIGPPQRRLAHAIYRLHSYADAGADCVFVPGFPGPDVPAGAAGDMIAELTDALPGIPVNLLADPKLPTLDELSALGVRRLSVGSGLYRLAMAAARDATARLLATGQPDALAAAAGLPYQELWDLLWRNGSAREQR